jgi:hypothetical protein
MDCKNNLAVLNNKTRFYLSGKLKPHPRIESAELSAGKYQAPGNDGMDYARIESLSFKRGPSAFI